MLNLEYPSLKGKTEAEQIAEIRRYLFQMVDALNYIINDLESKIDKGGKS